MLFTKTRIPGGMVSPSEKSSSRSFSTFPPIHTMRCRRVQGRGLWGSSTLWHLNNTTELQLNGRQHFFRKYAQLLDNNKHSHLGSFIRVYAKFYIIVFTYSTRKNQYCTTVMTHTTNNTQMITEPHPCTQHTEQHSRSPPHP